MLPSVPAAVACGVYVGTTPPVPVYVTNAVCEFEVGKTPVIAVAVTPGRAPLNTELVVKFCAGEPASGQGPVGRPVALTMLEPFGVPIARSVNAAVVAPTTS